MVKKSKVYKLVDHVRNIQTNKLNKQMDSKQNFSNGDHDPSTENREQKTTSSNERKHRKRRLRRNCMRKRKRTTTIHLKLIRQL